jgi:protein CpxP
MISFDRTSTGTCVAAAALFATTLVAAPTLGVAAGPKQARQAAIKSGAQRGDDVEARIKTLHSQLKIAPEQEPQWNAVAQQMRDNAKARADVRGDQTDAENTATAPDMINAYAKTMDAHAEGVHKFASVFQTLYDSMSEQQKKTADVVFREKVHRAAARKNS